MGGHRRSTVHNTQPGANFTTEYDVDLGLKANVYNAILKPESSQFWAQPQYICNTGNCTWNPVASISICPFCSDISTNLSMSCKSEEVFIEHGNNLTIRNCTVSLTNGFATWFLDGDLNGYPMVMDNSYENHNISPLIYKNYTLPLIQSIKALYNDTSSNFVMDLNNKTQFIATECSLAPCVRSVQASIIRSIYTESAPNYWFEHGTNLYNDVTLNPPWGPDLGVQEGQSFGIKYYPFEALNDYIASLFSGNFHLLSDTMTPKSSRPDILQSIFYGNFTDCDNPLDKVGCAVNNVAKAMSKSLWDMSYMSNSTEGANMTIGETFVSVTFVRIQWRWLIFPVVTWILSVVTLLGTIWKTRRAQVQTWRNSPFPLILLHRLNYEANGSYDISNAGLSTMAKKLRVKLHVPENNIHVTDYALD